MYKHAHILLMHNPLRITLSDYIFGWINSWGLLHIHQTSKAGARTINICFPAL